MCFYESALGQAIYSRRRTSVEPLIEHIKSVFRIDPLPARGFHAVSAVGPPVCFAVSDNRVHITAK